MERKRWPRLHSSFSSFVKRNPFHKKSRSFFLFEKCTTTHLVTMTLIGQHTARKEMFFKERNSVLEKKEKNIEPRAMRLRSPLLSVSLSPLQSTFSLRSDRLFPTEKYILGYKCKKTSLPFCEFNSKCVFLCVSLFDGQVCKRRLLYKVPCLLFKKKEAANFGPNKKL